MKSRLPVLGALALGLCAAPLAAKPIAFAKGKTVMVEYGAGTMNEVQLFYAPRYWWSAGGGWLELSSEGGTRQRHVTAPRTRYSGAVAIACVAPADGCGASLCPAP
jgi:hypothetical protein